MRDRLKLFFSESAGMSTYHRSVRYSAGNTNSMCFKDRQTKRQTVCRTSLKDTVTYFENGYENCTAMPRKTFLSS